jgi:uncharacterized protein (DUF1697 family)
MAVFIAMLRGVNVGGNILKMERLREVCGELGFSNISTYVQSGNVVFESDRAASSIEGVMEKRLAKECRLAPSVIVRTPGEMRKMIAGNPFLKEKGIDSGKLHVTFLAKVVANEAKVKLGAIKPGADRFHPAGKEIYLHCPVSYGKTKLSNNAIQKALGISATTRNWKTVNALMEMAEGR